MQLEYKNDSPEKIVVDVNRVKLKIGSDMVLSIYPAIGGFFNVEINGMLVKPQDDALWIGKLDQIKML